MPCAIGSRNLIYMYSKTEVSWLRDQSLKWSMIMQHPPFWEYETLQFNSNKWLGMYTAAHYNNKVCGQSGLRVLRFYWIRQLGAMWAWPDLHGCTGLAWDVTGIGAGMFPWTAGVVGTAGALFIWVASVAGVVVVGCMCCGRLWQCRLCHWEVVSSWEPVVWQLCHLEQCHPLWHCIHEGVSMCGSIWNHCSCILDSCSMVGHISQ